MSKAKGVLLLGIVVCIAALVSGCATCNKPKPCGSAEATSKDQVASLERTVQEKDAEIANLRDALAAAIQEKENAAKLATTTNVSSTVKPTTKTIQAALKNAGYDPGAVDGKIGKQTKEAIIAFQKANGLNGDGKVGSKTWALLSQYAEAK